MMPVLVEFLRVEMGGEVTAIGGRPGDVMERRVGRVVVVVEGGVVGGGQVVNRWSPTVRRPRGWRDDS